MTRIPVLAPLVLLAGCAAPSAYEMSADDQSELAELLGDRVPDEPVRCLPMNTQGSTAIDERTIVYRSGNTRYLQTFEADCNDVDRIGNALVIESQMGRTCSGDIARVVDTVSGMTGGVCVFRDFIPYRDPE
ncbi:DUF6491 family protein [Sphingomicrobium astaxanthinifaciens]|uniref:DUF6491 family protein n=1 Tax=Sphingomicrobium astaxanthinifaciens TaxID=1227949 RepID=UPI001FCAB09A|nr:DUF6491 family protein [Sphingomicrobium astaxanthinifaciens]MCJ7421329.1 DUF6491 family protein [Sphingomicrobium astaxanthinifaciens]